MTRKDDDAARIREDSFLAELVPQAAEHLAEQHAGDFGAEASRARFLTWLAAHAKEPAAPAKDRGNPSARNDLSVIALVRGAADRDQAAWKELVERYAPLVYAICTRYRLSTHDIENVGQTVWLLLVEHLGKFRDPAMLPGWLATTTARECLRVVMAARRSERLGSSLDDSVLFVNDAAIDAEILVAEQNAAMRAAFAELPPRCQQLLSMLISDPPRSYADISAELGIPVGSIGSQRARCLERLRKSALERLRKSAAFIALGEGETKVHNGGGEVGALDQEQSF